MLSNFTANIEAQFNIEKKELARGSFGYVNEAHRKSDDKHVAIKTMIDNEIDFNSSKSLLRELQLLATISHPKCLQLVAFTLSPVPKIVTPFMGHGTLQDVLMKKAMGKPDPNFNPTKMMCSIYGICSTMQFLHDRSIMHRDFKPLNIFLDDNYDICIADFGLSRKVEENVYLTNAGMGSPLYMAPELFTDEYDTYTNKIDVYSFGVSYLQYFTKLDTLNDKKGKIKSSQNLMMRIGKGARFTQPSGMNDDQYEVYIACTHQDINERPSFEQLCEVFETKESLLFDDVNLEEYQEYIKNCKKIIEDEKKKKEEEERMKQEFLNRSLSTSSSGSLLSSSSSSSKPAKKHKRY